MVAPIGLRDDFDAPALRALAKASRDPDQLRRFLSVAEIFDGGSARRRHYAQDRDAMAAVKKTSPPSWRRSPPKKPRART